MRVLETDKHETEIMLLAEEKRTIQKANRLLGRLAKFHGGTDEKTAAEIMVRMAAKWAPETAEKDNATK